MVIFYCCLIVIVFRTIVSVYGKRGGQEPNAVRERFSASGISRIFNETSKKERQSLVEEWRKKTMDSLLWYSEIAMLHRPYVEHSTWSRSQSRCQSFVSIIAIIMRYFEFTLHRQPGMCLYQHHPGYYLIVFVWSHTHSTAQRTTTASAWTVRKIKSRVPCFIVLAQYTYSIFRSIENKNRAQWAIYVFNHLWMQ